MVELPPELIDHITNFLSYEKPLWGNPDIKDKQVLLACTTVSRSFFHSARRRLFSTFVIGPLANTLLDLQCLYELVQRPYFVVPVQTLKLQIVEGQFWPLGSNDPHVQRVLSAFNQPDSSVQHLCLECPSNTRFNHNFGQLTQRELLTMVSRIHTLTIRGMATPIMFLENAPLLENITLLEAPLEVKNVGFKLPLPKHLKVVVLKGDVDQEVDALCQEYRDRRQELPGFEKVRLETSRSYCALKQAQLLQRSRDTLRLLEIKPYALTATPTIAQFDIGGLKNLRTLRLIFDVSGTMLSVMNYLLLHSLVKLSQGPTLPSSVTKIEVLVLCEGTMAWPTVDNSEILGDDVPRERFHHLNPRNLVKYHPALLSFDFIYDFSQIDFPAHQIQNRTMEEAECCLEQILRLTLERAILGTERVEKDKQAEISLLPYMSVRASCVRPSPWESYRNSLA